MRVRRPVELRGEPQRPRRLVRGSGAGGRGRGEALALVRHRVLVVEVVLLDSGRRVLSRPAKHTYVTTANSLRRFSTVVNGCSPLFWVLGQIQILPGGLLCESRLAEAVELTIRLHPRLDTHQQLTTTKYHTSGTTPMKA